MSRSNGLCRTGLIAALTVCLTAPSAAWAESPQAVEDTSGMTQVTVDVSELGRGRHADDPLAQTGDGVNDLIGAVLVGSSLTVLGASTLKRR